MRRARHGTPLELANGWKWIGAPYEEPVFRVDGALCVVSGVIQNEAFNPVVGVLPAECRPAERLVFTSMLNDEHVRIDVSNQGVLQIVYSKISSKGWMTLSGISFMTSNSKDVAVNFENGWKPFGEEYGTPKLAEQNGLCLMSGLLRAPGDSWPQPVRVPDSCKPYNGRAVFSVNNNEWNTRWDILPSGQVTFSGGYASYRWTSLDGIIWTGKGAEGEDIELLNGFVNYANGFRNAKFVRVGRVCSLSGLVEAGGRRASPGQPYHVVGRLPASCRPKKRVVLAVPHNDKYRLRVDVQPDGMIILPGQFRPGGSWFSLEGAHFVADVDETLEEFNAAKQLKKRIAAEALEKREKYLQDHPDFAKSYRLAVGKPLKLTNGYRAYNDEYGAPTWRVFDGVCFLSGVAYGEKEGPFAELPSRCRPAASLVFNVLRGGRDARINVRGDGQVILRTSNSYSRWISLDGVYFHINSNSNAESGFSLNVNGGIRPFLNGYRSPQANVHRVGGHKFCLLSGRVISPGQQLGNVPHECKQADGRLIFNTNNHQQASRVDILAGDGNVFAITGRQHGWNNLDNILYAPDGGTELDLRNGWGNFEQGYRRAKAYKVGDLCILSGLIQNGDFAHGYITKLPTWCRPATRLIFGANIHELGARVDVQTNGEVMWVANTYGNWLSLSGIAFIAAPHVAGLDPNKQIVTCSTFWADKQLGCPATQNRKSGAGEASCNPFELQCVPKCCEPKKITCAKFYSIDDGGRCPAGWRSNNNHGSECWTRPDGADSCTRRCCSYVPPGHAGKCTNWGDPHVITLDGLSYDCRSPGEFVMLSNPKLDEEVHNIQVKNPRRDLAYVPPFNAGIAWRSRRDIISFQLLAPQWEIFRVVLRYNGRTIPWPEKRVTYGDFELQPNGMALPDAHAGTSDKGFHNLELGIVNRRTGTSIMLNTRQAGYFQRYIDWHVTQDQSQFRNPSTWGLCGTWDGNRNNDLMVKGGGRQCGWWDSDTCCNSYMVATRDTYFTKAPESFRAGKAPSAEEVCGTSDKLAEANKVCQFKPKEYVQQCVVEVCSGGSAKEVTMAINNVRKGHE